MKRRLSPVLLLLAMPLVFLCTAGAQSAPAQTVPPLDKIQNQEELDRAVTTLDAAVFDAYNKCDLEKFASSSTTIRAA